MATDEYGDYEQEYYEEESDYADEPYDEPEVRRMEDEENRISEREIRERRILAIHPFLPGRPVVVKDNSNTRNKGWHSGAQHEGKAGKSGHVVEVHERELEAVRISFGDDRHGRFWHYKDLMLVEVEEEEIPPVHFNPLNLVI